MTEYVKVFVCGGILCVIAQILIDKTKLTPARILTGYVVIGVILTAIGWYKPFVDFAGCGATVPLTGFGYSLMAGVRKATEEKGIIGILTGGLSGTAGGITAAVVFSFMASLIFKGKSK